MTVLAPSIGAIFASDKCAGRTSKMRKRFTEDEITQLSQSPYVKYIRANRISFTFEFRTMLWERWQAHPSITTIKKALYEYGLDPCMIGSPAIHSLQEKFKVNGRPRGGKNKAYGEIRKSSLSHQGTTEILLSTGKFIKSGWGITFHPDLVNEIRQYYPDKSIEDSLRDNGIDPAMVGYQRIYQLKRKLAGSTFSYSRSHYEGEWIAHLKDHPYVKRANSHQLSLKDCFYQDAQCFNTLPIDEILQIFKIDPNRMPMQWKSAVKSRINRWSGHEQVPICDAKSPLMIEINHQRIQKLTEMIDECFARVKGSIKDMSPSLRKILCQWIRTLPHDRHDYSLRKVLDKVGISKSSYYAILSDPDYDRIHCRDEQDIRLIQQVLDSEPGYPMGSRMVYMKMRKITGQQFGRKKIMRLMRKYDLLCPVRKASASRKAARRLLEHSRKPNILKRQFRLQRPLRIFLSDVTYLKYGLNQTAYLSTTKDAATGRILACVVSEDNDLRLVEDTIDQLIDKVHEGHLLFHTDQGVLYLNEYIQDKLKKSGFTQSMSRRGNCWDNAPQESFFGHFKDECDYSWCTTVEEIRSEAEDYVEYYNDRRPQWDRNKMTPMAFEKYLTEMDDDAFERYVSKEREKYDKMMARSKEKALRRAQELGAIREEI